MEEEVFLCRVLSPEGGRLSGCFSSWDYEQLAEDILLCRALSTEAGQAFSAVGTMRKLRRKSFCVESCHLKGGRLFSLRRKSFCVESCHLQGGRLLKQLGYEEIAQKVYCRVLSPEGGQAGFQQLGL